MYDPLPNAEPFKGTLGSQTVDLSLQKLPAHPGAHTQIGSETNARE
jgi:hypothetical protein